MAYFLARFGKTDPAVDVKHLKARLRTWPLSEWYLRMREFSGRTHSLTRASARAIHERYQHRLTAKRLPPFPE
jgi:hypothetical protein